MKKRNYLLLLPLLWAACSKDDNTLTFRGIVLHQTTHAPIAGAEVEVFFGLYTGPATSYKAITDARGEYTINTPGKTGTGRLQYFVLCRKAKLVQPQDNTLRLVAGSHPDTLIMDDARYVNMTLRVAPMTANESSQFFVWELLHELDDRTDIDVSLQTGKRVVLSTQPAGTTISVLDSFARVDVAKVFVKHFKGTIGSDQVLVKKVVPVQPADTTHIIIQ